MQLNRPHFLVVGPAKTGTTWLYEQLKLINGFEMPPTKEINFFSELNFLHIINPRSRKALEEFEMAGYEISVDAIATAKGRFINRRQINRQYAAEQMRPLWGWYYRYFPRNMGGISSYLYSLLFATRNNGTTGDISPLYFGIGEQVIKEIAKWFPELKIVLIIREPVDRAWSNIRMNYYSTQAMPDFSIDSYLAKHNLGSDYKRAITNWERYFKPNQIMYLFYDDLVDNPTGFLQQFLDFVKPGAKATHVIEETIGKGVNKQMDSVLMEQLLKKNWPQYQFLAQKFGPDSYPAQWLKEAEIKLELLKTRK